MYNSNAEKTELAISRYFQDQRIEKLKEKYAFKEESTNFVEALINNNAAADDWKAYISTQSIEYVQEEHRKQEYKKESEKKRENLVKTILSFYKNNKNALCTFEFLRGRNDCSHNLLVQILTALYKEGILSCVKTRGVKYWFNVRTYDTTKPPQCYECKPRVNGKLPTNFLNDTIKQYVKEEG